MKLQSCQNCWFNGLQYGTVGLPIGFCARHRTVLNLSDETTCGLHIRKDLGLERAQQVAAVHVRAFDKDKIVRLTDGEENAADFSSLESNLAYIRTDPVGEAVLDYGSLNSKIESLAQLKTLETLRSDVAMSSLGRAYVRNCVNNGGAWTSGIHLYWWTKKRLATVPELRIEDILYSGSIQFSRYAELVLWSVMMLRLTFIDDIVQYARRGNDDLGRAGDVLNEAATAVQSFDVKKLSRWIKKDLSPILDARLDYRRYSSIAVNLHKDAPYND